MVTFTLLKTNKISKVFITGALGHIGSRILREIPTFYPEAQIVMLDNMSSQRYCSLFNLPVQGKYHFIEGDVLEVNLGEIVKGADVVLHLAAITDAANSFRNKKKVEEFNYNATVKVAEACRDNNCPMIHISSTSVYGTQLDVVDEDCSDEQLQPQSPYAETKLKEEGFLKALGASGALRFIICRFGTIYGVSPGMRFHTAVNKFCWQAVMGQPITVWKTAMDQKRPYLGVNDAVRAIKFIINENLFGGEVYNVVTSNNTVRDIVDTLKEYVPGLKCDLVESKIMNQLSYHVLSKRFESKGFICKDDIKKGIKETIYLLKNTSRLW